MSNFTRPALLSFALLSLSMGGVRGNDADTWENRFVKEAPAQWQAYLDGAKDLQGSATSIFEEGGKVVRRFQAEFKQNKTCALLRVENPSGKTRPESLYAMNAQYGFKLGRASAEKPWAVLGEQLDLEKGYKLNPSGYSPAGNVEFWLGMAHNIFGRENSLLPEVSKDGDFSVRSASPVLVDGQALVRVEFAARPKKWTTKSHPNETDWMPLRGGWLVFDPEKYWVIRECHVEFQNWGAGAADVRLMDGKFEYKEGKKGFPVLKRIVRGFPLSGSRQTIEFDLSEKDDVPDSDFTLSAFGLPEPAELKTARPQAWYIWAGLAGGVCLALGGGLRWMAKRRAA
jgi:hypothetical protein